MGVGKIAEKGHMKEESASYLVPSKTVLALADLSEGKNGTRKGRVVEGVILRKG